MVKSLIDELSDILEWIESAETIDYERAHAGLVCFCRGLVCGLRAGNKVQAGNEPSVTIEGLSKEPDTSWDITKEKIIKGYNKAEARRRRYDENAQMRPVDKCDRVMMGKTPLEERLKY